MVLPTEMPSPKKAVQASDITNILNAIKRKNADDSTETPAKQPKVVAKKPKPKKPVQKIPRGQPKSNRPWKEVKQK